ncbi:MAG TPA: c-type cytochrome [Usitatibacter sp.]|nr:c-type cytochrome [Usitatibacter sp.]
MSTRPMRFTAAVLAACFACAAAIAQQAAPPPPAFAPSDLTPPGVRAMAANCAGCHGTDGRATAAGKRDLSLAGYSRESFVRGMTMYRDGKRKATVMHQVAKGYTDEEIAALADYFSKQRR